MYSEIKNKDEKNASLLLTIMSYHKYITKVSERIVNSHDNNQNLFPFQVINIVPLNLHHIQPRDTQVWNWYEIGFDSNGKWHKIVWTYKLFQG